MKWIKYILITIIIMIALLLLTGCSIETPENNTDNTIVYEDTREVITVTDKWVKRTNDRDLYLIGTENEVFKIEDNIFKWNSSDLYNKIKTGKKYKITATGIRSNFFSSYRNINSIEEVEE